MPLHHGCKFFLKDNSYKANVECFENFRLKLSLWESLVIFLMFLWNCLWKTRLYIKIRTLILKLFYPIYLRECVNKRICQNNKVTNCWKATNKRLPIPSIRIYFLPNHSAVGFFVIDQFSKDQSLILKSYGNECPFINDLCTTFSGHFLPYVCLSFTKLRFWRSFWGP